MIIGLDSSGTPTSRSPKRLGRLTFLLALAAMLLAPLCLELVSGGGPQRASRMLAPAPGWPQDWTQLVDWPRRASAFLNDHFGLRRSLVQADTRLRWYGLGDTGTAPVFPGRNGRALMSWGERYRDILIDCGAVGGDWHQSIAKQIEPALGQALLRLPQLRILAVPTFAVLYPQDLLPWMTRACAGHTPLVTGIVARLPSAQRDHILYPLGLAGALPPSEPLIPPHRSHWRGAGAARLLDQIATDWLQQRKEITLPLRQETLPTDLEGLLPSTGLVDRVAEPLWQEAKVTACVGSSCFAGATLPPTTLRFSRGDRQHRLLVIGDSFGETATAGLVPFYDDVLFLNLNDFEQYLSPERRDAAWRSLAAGGYLSDVLLVFNDNNVFSLPRFLGLIPDIAAMR